MTFLLLPPGGCVEGGNQLVGWEVLMLSSPAALRVWSLLKVAMLSVFCGVAREDHIVSHKSKFISVFAHIGVIFQTQQRPTVGKYTEYI